MEQNICACKYHVEMQELKMASTICALPQKEFMAEIVIVLVMFIVVQFLANAQLTYVNFQEQHICGFLYFVL